MWGMTPSAKASPDDELARARLAFISAGQPALGAARRAVAPSGNQQDAEDGEEYGGARPPTRSPERLVRIPDRFSLTTRQSVAVLLLLLCGVVVTLTALGRSSASQLPVEAAPVTVTSAVSVASPTPSPAAVRVHVLGAVPSPGVVTVVAGSIVQDAVLAAGGLAADADPAELNLAAPVADGQQVIVGTVGEPRGELVQRSSSGAAGQEGESVNLNTATVAQLEELPGVGPVTAAAIVAWREDNGGFSSVADLQEVSGIGPKGFAKLEPLVSV